MNRIRCEARTPPQPSSTWALESSVAIQKFATADGDRMRISESPATPENAGF
jgi:hypothetical protein